MGFVKFSKKVCQKWQNRDGKSTSQLTEILLVTNNFFYISSLKIFGELAQLL